jgi:hypothetical protein
VGVVHIHIDMEYYDVCPDVLMILCLYFSDPQAQGMVANTASTMVHRGEQILAELRLVLCHIWYEFDTDSCSF